VADLNKVMLIGRLTRDIESRTFTTGGKVAKFGLAVAYMRDKKNPTTGEWEGGETTFIDIEVFNRENRQLADLAEKRLKKGSQVYLEGRLRLNKWTTQDGQERQKLLVVVDNMEFLDARTDGGYGGGGGDEGGSSAPRRSSSPAPARKAAAPAPRREAYDDDGMNGSGGGDESPSEDNIPF